MLNYYKELVEAGYTLERYNEERRAWIPTTVIAVDNIYRLAGTPEGCPTPRTKEYKEYWQGKYEEGYEVKYFYNGKVKTCGEFGFAPSSCVDHILFFIGNSYFTNTKGDTMKTNIDYAKGGFEKDIDNAKSYVAILYNDGVEQRKLMFASKKKAKKYLEWFLNTRDGFGYIAHVYKLDSKISCAIPLKEERC